MKLITPQNWVEYELIDAGNFEKLERFGKYVVSRPEPQAIWDKALSEKEWHSLANAEFNKEKSGGLAGEKGEWLIKPGMAEQWHIGYQYKEMTIKMRLGLTSFKHVGIFPEQADNWNYIYDSLTSLKTKETPKVLNLFAYTGGASLVAKAAGADVVHVDSIKQVINWSAENMAASKLSDIRWVIEDAVKFVNREVKRGKQYNGIILDPPSYGHGPNGEKWILEDKLNELLKQCKQLLNPQNNFFILNLYSTGVSSIMAETLVESIFGKQKDKEVGALYLTDKSGRKLPTGVLYRFKNL
jgi:23S rRNA (cytosine1962-C5)-methyltransferase